MIKLSNELKKELLEAKTAEQVKEILGRSGQEFSEEDAERVLQEVAHHQVDTQLSLDELESVSGGKQLDWLVDGCAATVEAGSRCWTNDACSLVDVTYKNRPIQSCPVCDGVMYLYENNREIRIFKCVNCGNTIEYENPEDRLIL